jgi:glucosamine-6-phosphate deaminase
MLTRALARPSHGLTLGMGDILASRSIVLLVFGNRKAEQLNRLLTGGATSHFPASFLTLHRDVLCVCDEAAAARLPRKVPGGSEP